MKTGRDIKFVIYQVLYIFVICVIALKGADINLVEVIDSELAKKLQRERDSLIALGLISPIKWDTNKIYSQADLELILRDYIKIDQKKRDTNEGGITSENQTGNGPGVTTGNTGNNNNSTTNEGTTIKKPVPPEFTQYTMNSIKNNYNKDLIIYGDGKLITTVKPQGSTTLKIGNEKEIKFEVDGISASTPTKEKQPPKIDIQKFISDGSDVSLRSIQGRVGYRVTIVSSYAGDLIVNINGPVKIDKVSSTQFDISLNLLASESAFDAWSKGKVEPYKVSFTVSVKDKYNPKHSISQIGVFTFGKW